MAAPARALPASAFTRLLLVFVATGLLLNVLVVGFFAWTLNAHGVRPADRQIADYVTYLLGELGDPPSEERALAISRRSSLSIGYEGPAGRWLAGARPIPWRRMRLRRVEGYDGLLIGGMGDRQAVVIERGESRILFELPRRLVRQPAPVRLFLVLATVVTLLVGGAWLVMRQVFRPLRHLEEGVARVAAGDLAQAVPEEGSREFAELAHGFNEMRESISQMLAMRERLLLDVSHELRSPLTRMRVALEFLPEGAARASLAEDVLDMEQMVTAILETARLARPGEQVRRSRVDLAAAARAVAARFTDRLPGVRMGEAGAPVWVEGDPDLLSTVVRNLVDNALKFSAGSTEPVRVAVEELGNAARLTVSDSGVGIAAEDLPRIFDPFYRVDRSRSRPAGGYGLGLSLCKSIVAAHGGAIAASSAAGAGTTLTVTLPLAAAAPAVPAAPPVV